MQRNNTAQRLLLCTLYKGIVTEKGRLMYLYGRRWSASEGRAAARPILSKNSSFVSRNSPVSELWLMSSSLSSCSLSRLAGMLPVSGCRRGISRVVTALRVLGVPQRPQKHNLAAVKVGLAKHYEIGTLEQNRNRRQRAKFCSHACSANNAGGVVRTASLVQRRTARF